MDGEGVAYVFFYWSADHRDLHSFPARRSSDLRFYGFSPPGIGEAATDGMLDLAIDPKLAWALNRREQFPVDVNTAPREMLLRVPGLGVKSVDRMISVRRYRTQIGRAHV